MVEQNKNIVKKCLERVELVNKPTLVLTEEFKRKIDFLHKKAGATEWSGELITREEGCITDLDDWKIICEDIFLVDIGSPGYTSYEVDKGSFKAPDIIELYDKYPGLMDGSLKNHGIHTHHGMRAFFSSTDWENLGDRACESNYFLMLIVNFSGEYCAKVAYKGVQKGNDGVELEFANNVDGIPPLKLGSKKDRDVLVVMDCKIVIESVEIEVDEEFKNRYDSVVEQHKKEVEERVAKQKEYSSSGGIKGMKGQEHGTWKNGTFYPDKWSGGQWGQGMLGIEQGYDWPQEDNEEYVYEKGVWVKKLKKEKKINEMTEKEWNKSQETVEKFDIRHAKAFLNSILDTTYMPNNFEDCIGKIEQDDREIKSVAKLEEYIDIFEDMLQEHFDVIWPNGKISEYNELLQVVVDYLLPYKYNRLIAEMIDVIEQEIRITQNDLV